MAIKLIKRNQSHSLEFQRRQRCLRLVQKLMGQVDHWTEEKRWNLVKRLEKQLSKAINALEGPSVQLQSMISAWETLSKCS